MKLVIITVEKNKDRTMLIIIWSEITNEWRKKNQNGKRRCFGGSW